MAKHLNKISFALVILLACEILMSVSGLVFRCFYYFRLPVQPEEAYGVADIIEFFLGTGTMVVGAGVIILAFGLMVARAAPRSTLVGIILAGLVLPPVIFMFQQNTHKLGFCRR